MFCKKKIKSQILIIGKRPLPIGGVTIHVDRLVKLLDKLQYDYTFYDLNKFTIYSFIKAISASNIVHLHTSSPILRVFFAICCLAQRKTSLITYHGDLGRFGFVMNFFDFCSVRLCTYPIVINNHSLNMAIKYNFRSTLLSAYIPSIEEPDLEDRIKSELIKLRTKFSFVCITNAYNYSLDKYGQEIYGISDLIAFFAKRLNWGLVISDPSGMYKKKNHSLPRNIIILNRPHSFQKVFDYADCFIRYTSTDGDCLSIHEALDFGLSVVATDVVDRPRGVCAVKRSDMEGLFVVLDNISNLKNKRKFVKHNISDLALIRFYDKIIAELK